MTSDTFASMPLAAPIQQALADRGYVTPSPIQAQAIPMLLEGRDLLGCAQTGTGKTAAFSLPILNALHLNPQRPRPKSARVLVLTPTRELATQVGRSLEIYGSNLRIRHALIFGGVGQNPQVSAMRQGVDILVACPGRLLDLVNQRFVDLSQVEFFVLDEVDRMLDMGFLRDVQKIVALLPDKRQSLFFSATLAPPIVKLAHAILRDPATVTITPEVTTAERVAQRICFVSKENKPALLAQKLNEVKGRGLSIVFSRTKHGANKLVKQLAHVGISAEAIHGNRSQSQREKTLEKFRAGRLPVLVATDVAARGVDVKDVTLVINYDLPVEAEAYVHRIGRTGRAGASGEAVSFCCPDEREALLDIEKLIRSEIPTDDDHQWHLSNFTRIPLRGGGGRRMHDTQGSRPARQGRAPRPDRSQRQARPSGTVRTSRPEREGRDGREGAAAGNGEASASRPRQVSESGAPLRSRSRRPYRGR